MTTACCRNSGFPNHSLLACVMMCADWPWPIQSYLIVKSRFTCSQIWEWPGRPRLCSGESLMRWIRDVLDLIWGRDENNCSRRKKGRDGFVTSWVCKTQMTQIEQTSILEGIDFNNTVKSHVWKSANPSSRLRVDIWPNFKFKWKNDWLRYVLLNVAHNLPGVICQFV